MTSAASCPRSAASAPTAARRTFASASFRARSTRGSQRSAASVPAASATFSVRARISADSCANRSGVTRCRLSIASSSSMA